jgi:Enoyl-CoA hydratase/carnithine racemase
MKYNYQHIRIEKIEPRIAVLSFIRPEKLNSWTNAVIDDMLDFFKKLKQDTDTTILIMRADGTKAYCAGADFQEIFPGETRDSASVSYAFQAKCCELILDIYTCPQIVIMQAFGYTIGGGFFTAMASDIRIIADNVKFQAPLVKFGLGCGDLGASYFLTRQIGSGAARDLLLTGRYMLADEAMRLGFASACVPLAELDASGLEKAQLLAGYNPVALKFSKEVMNMAQDANSLEDVLNFENRNQQMIKAFNLEQKAARS